MSVNTGVSLNEKSIEELSARLGEPQWMRAKRLAALRAYLDLGLPKWDRTDLTGLRLDEAVQLPAPSAPEPAEADLPAVLRELVQSRADGQGALAIQLGDGSTRVRLPAALEKKGVIVCDFATALAKHEAIVKEHFMSAVPFDEDKFTALHCALTTTGFLVYVPKNVSVETPIELRIYSDTPGEPLFPHILVVADQASEVTIVEGVGSSDGDRQRFVGEIVEVCPKDGAQVRFASVQNWGEETFNITTRRSVLARDARVEWVAGDFGSRLSRSHARSVLTGTGSESTNVSVFFGTGRQHLDVGIHMKHVGDHTSSDILTRGVLSDRARVVYRGLTDIENGARFTSAFQRENTMLLSEHARSDAIPGLEIDETEVQAGHAATVGQIDKVHLFYLMSRGLPKKDAIHLIVAGFLDPVLQKVPLEGVRVELRGLTDRKMAG